MWHSRKYFLNELMGKLTRLSSVHSHKVLKLHMARRGRMEMTQKVDFEARLNGTQIQACQH